MWDVIIIGSGISGLTAAAALSRAGQKVLLLEQHWVAGGLTQTFKRGEWQFATGVHYLSGMDEGNGPGGQFRRLLDWLGGDVLRFSPLANPYDLVHIGEFAFGIAHPKARFQTDLLARFPDERAEIDHWFEQADAAVEAASMVLVERGLPGWLAAAVRFWKGKDIEHFARATVAEALAAFRDPCLRAILGARGGDYGAAAADAPLLEHAMVTGAYHAGAFYPVGGPAALAKALVPVLQEAGGKLLLRADAQSIDLADGRIAGVTYARGGKLYSEQARHVISTMGLLNTLDRLPPDAAPAWRKAALDLKPGPAYVALYLGFEGDIAAAGASSANIWLYETTDAIDRFWDHPDDADAPGLFVSFPSLKDPAHVGGDTAEVLALCSADAFGALDGGRSGRAQTRLCGGERANRAAPACAIPPPLAGPRRDDPLPRSFHPAFTTPLRPHATGVDVWTGSERCAARKWRTQNPHPGTRPATRRTGCNRGGGAAKRN